MVVHPPQATETELFDDVVTAVKGVAAGEIVYGALKGIEGTAAETRRAIGVVAMTGTAGRGGEGRREVCDAC